MSIGAMIKSFFIGTICAIFLMLIIGFVLMFVFAFVEVSDNVATAIFIILAVILFPVCIWGAYENYKQKSTCPRCKMPFVFYEKCVGSETLSEDYISQDVKGSDGVYRRRSYKVGKERNYYESKCKECGYTKERQAVSNFKREI